MKSKRKSPKPITLLTRIETLLSDALDQLSSIERSVERNVRDLLLAASESVSQAKDFITPAASYVVAHKATKGRKRAGRRSRPARAR